MRKELYKLIEVKINFPIKYSTWVANLVSVHKKSDEIRLYVDFIDLNKAYLKDHHLFCSMEQILQNVADVQKLSMLDGSLGFNQILGMEEDQFKMTFTTKWGTYAYQKMPFGLSNGAMFQHAMDIAFKCYINKFILVYLDDITVFSKHSTNHMTHLEKVFERCIKYGVSLTHKK